MSYNYPGLGDQSRANWSAHDPGQAYGRRWKWSVNAMLIGTSQSGKSTLINRFRSLAVGPYPSTEPAETGDGGGSCTIDPFLYEFDIPVTDFVLVENASSSQVDVPEDEGTIFSGFWKRGDMQVRRRNPNADIVRLRLLDTPGLDDSRDGMNAKNIENVLRYLSELGKSEDLDLRHISAVMFVVKSSGSFSDSLQTWYHYYRQCMPNLFGSLAVINTNYRLKDWKTEYGKKALNVISLGGAKLSTRDMKMKLRREAWAETFRSDPQHFFIDSKPGRNKAFEDLISVNTVYDMLLYLRSQGKLPIENIRLAKLGQMTAIDGRLAGCLYDISCIWERERDHLLKSMSTTDRSLSQHTKNKLLWENRIEELKRKLEIWDTDITHDLNTYSPTEDISAPSRTWKYVTFRGHENTYEITEKLFPFSVDAPDNDDTTWLSRKGPSESDRVWRGKYKSRWRKVPKFSARSYTTNRIWRASEITKAREDINEMMASIEETVNLIAEEKALIEQSRSQSEHSPRVAQLDEWLAHAEKYTRLLRETEVPLSEGFAQTAVSRYSKTLDKIDYDDVLDFVAENDPELRPAFAVIATYLARNARMT